MTRRRSLLPLALLAAAACAAPLGAQGSDFPTRPLTLVAPYPAGGSLDTVARVLAKALGARLGQTVIVDNKAGAGTAIGTGAVARAEPDGYTLLISSNTTFTINPALKSKLPYDPVNSFDAIGLLGGSPLVLLAHPAVPAHNVKEVVALAKSMPGKLTYASFGTGTTSHFAGEMFKVMAGIDIVHVPYKGSAPAMQDLIGGQVQLSFDVNVAAMPQVQAGKVRAIAVTSKKRTASMPGVPTFNESGLPDYEMVPWLAVLAPRGLPADVHQILVKALAAVLADAGTRAELTKVGVDVEYGPPTAYAPRVAKELPLIRAYVHKAGITAD